MIDKQHIYKQLEIVLFQENECANTLLDILANERSAIVDNPEKLTSLVSSKQEKTSQMEHLNEQRNLLLKQGNFEPNQIKDCIQWCSADEKSMAKLIEKLATLLTTIDQCRQYNLTNGTIIESTSNRVRQSLAILHGQKPENIGYSEQGKTVDSGTRRTIGRV